MALRVSIAAAIAFIALQHAAYGDEKHVVETEPNNTPQQAVDVSAPATLIGTLAGSDQDAYNWLVTDEDASRRWTLELHGIPGRLTIVVIAQLEYNDVGDVTAKDILFKTGTRDGSLPSISEGLIFEPGEYLLGVAHSGGGSMYRPPTDSASFGGQLSGAETQVSSETGGYRVRLLEGARIPASKGGDLTSREKARKVQFGRETSQFLERQSSAWYRLDVGEAEVSSRWEIRVNVPVGQGIDATLTSEDGTQLAQLRSDNRGRLRMPDLSLPAGSYLLEVEAVKKTEGLAGFVHVLNVVEIGQKTEGSEAEPNDSWKLANIIEPGKCCTGRIARKGDEDFYRFTLDEVAAGQVHDIVTETDPAQSLMACLLDSVGAQIQCRDGKGEIALRNLLLPPGDYGFRIMRGKEGAEYRVSLNATGEPQQGQEYEPNDRQDYAFGTPSKNRIKGSFDSRGDRDFYKIVIPEKPQLWRVQAIGDGIAKVEFHDLEGREKQRAEARRGQRRVRLENLFLLPGTHKISVTGRSKGNYTLLARGIGPPDPNGELEPNDTKYGMQPLKIGQTRTGLLNETHDIDNYRFHLADWDHIRIEARPPADGQIQAKLIFNNMLIKNASNTSGAVVLEGLYPPGNYRLELAAKKISEAEYTLSLQRKDRFQCTSDCEPNDSAVFASSIPPDQIIEGTAGDGGDFDWYVLPESGSERALAVQATTGADLGLKLFDAGLRELTLEKDVTANIYTGLLPAGGEAFLRVGRKSRISDYSLAILFDARNGPLPISPELSTSMSLELESGEVAAYERVGQVVSGTVNVVNKGSVAMALSLETAVSDARWRLELDDDEISLDPGVETRVPANLVVPTDAWAGIPVRVSVKATSTDGRHATAYADLSVDAEVPPHNPRHGWGIPERLRGGIDVARHQFGATIDSVPKPANPQLKQIDHLIDGMVSFNQGPNFGGSRKSSVSITVDLAGNEAVPVAGFGLNPLASVAHNFGHSPRDVEFQLSSDGANFETVTKGKLNPVGTDQYFVLEETRPAKFARLLLSSNWTGQADGPLSLGEFKVIAKPGFDPFGGVGQDLADPMLGGHVVWAKPRIGASWDKGILTAKVNNPSIKVPEHEPAEWVIGFHHDRAALIRKLQWTDSTAHKHEIEEVSLSVSVDSPVGPWTPLATWKLKASGNSLQLESPVWARFLRFSVAPVDGSRVYRAPEKIAVFESPANPAYRSILGEWGYESEAAYYESTLPVQPRPRLARRGNESKDSAASLNPGVTESGMVSLNKQSQWYRPAVPPGHNTLTLSVGGDPTVRAELEIKTASGEMVEVHKLERQSTSSEHVFEASVDPSQAHFIEVREPPRNVMFVWDTSASVGQYLPIIHNSLLAYAEDLVPGRDAANLLPFGRGSPLLQTWYGEPYLMQLILNDYRKDDGSSAAETAQMIAARELAPLPGTKAIVMVTDARTTRQPRMWDAYKEVKPRVFGLKVASGLPTPMAVASQVDLMQDWSRVNGGHYTYLDGEGEMEIAFDRAAALLRRPAAYSLALETEFREAPGPGMLRVLSGAGGNRSSGAVELILDASGSMWQKLDGRFRIDIAKEVLTTALREHIPASTPTAIRVFGHRKPNACDSDLLMPLAPLDVSRATAAVQGIQPQSLAKTPLADSIAAVRRDLKGSSGESLVVLVTDGKETCEGDPAKEIKKLRDAGLAISLNIVGFAIDDDSLTTQFEEWAEAGGGHYFVANDAKGLSDAMANALSLPYTVYDSSGEAVAAGAVGGEAIELPAGEYRVVVATSPQRVFDAVKIGGGSAVELKLE